MTVSQAHKKPSKSTVTKMRRLVFPRDNWTCQDCGLHIPPKSEDELAGRYAPSVIQGWLELDHVIPKARGGLFIASNLRAACSPCNRRKSDSTCLADWPTRIEMAVEALRIGDASEQTALRAIRILTGGEC